MYLCMYDWYLPPAAYVKVWIQHCSELVKYSVGRREAKWLLVITAVTIIALYLKAFVGR